MLITFMRADIFGGEIDSVTKGNITEDNLTELYNLAQEHDLAHIVADVLFTQKLMPDVSISEAYRAKLLIALARYQRQCFELESVCNLLEENCIPHIPLKGSVIRKYYPEPWLRTSGDIDILIKPEDLEKAGNLIISKLKYTKHGVSAHDWCLLSEDNILVELHYSLIEQNEVHKGRKRHKWNSEYLENVWESAILAENKKYKYVMTNELFYFYHIAHMAKHFEIGGCGLRTFIDLQLLNDKMDYNRSEKKKMLDKSGLLNFEKYAKGLANVWFSNGKYNEIIKFMESYILTSGAFGNVENKVAVQQIKHGSKTRYALNRIWLPYEKLKFYYPVIENKKWLIPVFQMRRWFKLLFLGGVKRSVKELTVNSVITVSEREITKRMLDELGL